jgi:hypothetical protein
LSAESVWKAAKCASVSPKVNPQTRDTNDYLLCVTIFCEELLAFFDPDIQIACSLQLFDTHRRVLACCRGPCPRVAGKRIRCVAKRCVGQATRIAAASSRPREGRSSFGSAARLEQVLSKLFPLFFNDGRDDGSTALSSCWTNRSPTIADRSARLSVPLYASPYGTPGHHHPGVARRGRGIPGRVPHRAARRIEGR